MSGREVADDLGATAGDLLRGPDLAMTLVDADGMISLGSPQAAALLGYPATKTRRISAVDLLATTKDREAVLAAGKRWAGQGWDGVLGLRHRDGHAVRVVLRVRPLAGPEGWAGWSVGAADALKVEQEAVDRAILEALFSQSPIAITVMDSELRHRRVNAAAERATALPADRLIGRRIGEVAPAVDAQTIEQVARQVRDTGEPVLDFRVRGRVPSNPDREGLWSGSSFRLTDPSGRVLGTCQTFFDISEGQRAQKRLRLLTQAGGRIGTTLDVGRTAQDLVDVLVPAFGDLAWVDLAEAVVEGDEPPKLLGAGHWHVRRAAVASADGRWPDGLPTVGEAPPPLPDLAALRRVQRGETVLLPDRASAIAAAEGHPDMVPLFVPEHGRSMVAAALFARGLVLGILVLWRTERTEPFHLEDANALAEIAARAALSVDNARRYTREHRANVALQKRLLPPATTDTPAAETAGFYVPAGGGAEISGDWYDVIPLPSLRVAVVAGDVAGHGLAATATMGRLRTAVDTLADLELQPEELLTRLDDLVQRLQSEAPHHEDAVYASCLYAVHDPVARRCTLASAGHPSPVVVRPDGTVQTVEVSAGPLLGVGGMPFEATTIDLEPGSLLALYTKGLIRRDDHDLDAGLRQLTESLAAFSDPDRDLGDIGHVLLGALCDVPPRDDIALLLTRTRAISPENTTSWEFPADAAVVADARSAVAHQLAAWELDELVFSTELMVSELVTNAVRYAGGPVGLRLIRENVLVCEVSDPSNTQPRLRRAQWSDEGGRGLFLVAQLATRWGSRYGHHGKTIWAEQALHTAAPRL
ncbi:SpoIIE family protein phosphatase [Streptomyces canus]|uniref:SpoIIE family protein phosphatase n=1 Tax=Streptomyces canus TaxID=58343 RepID=UPI0036E141C2